MSTCRGSRAVARALAAIRGKTAVSSLELYVGIDPGRGGAPGGDAVLRARGHGRGWRDLPFSLELY
jgi:hypothetical protein